MKTNPTNITCMALGVAFLAGCQHPQPKPQPQSHVIYSTSQTFSKKQPVPAHEVATIRCADGTYDTFTFKHGKLVSKKNSPTPP